MIELHRSDIKPDKFGTLAIKGRTATATNISPNQINQTALSSEDMLLLSEV